HRAFIGVGFPDREDAFDFNVALQDHFKWVKQEADASKHEQELEPCPKLDLGFKEGQTIQLQIGNMKRRDRSRPRTATGGTVPLLPPPGGRTAGASPTRSAGDPQIRRIGGADPKATQPDVDSNPISLDKSNLEDSTPQASWVQF
ncbi:adaptin ear-binding coat-associated protein 2-like, partial [Mustelus asterias]